MFICICVTDTLLSFTSSYGPPNVGICSNVLTELERNDVSAVLRVLLAKNPLIHFIQFLDQCGIIGGIDDVIP